MPGSRGWWIQLVRNGFGLPFWIFAGFAVVAAAVCYVTLGPDVFQSIVSEDLALLTGTVPRVAAAQLMAGLVWVLVPRERCLALIGANSGRRGLFVATAAGIITPGGPASAFSLLAIVAAAGADRGILVTYITSWALLALQRIIVWDLPFMGPEFSLTRFLCCLPLPLLAGTIARHLPIEMVLVEGPAQSRADH